MRRFWLLSIILCGVLLASCSSFLTQNTGKKSNHRKGDYQAVTQLGKAYQNYLEVKFEFNTACIEKIFEYDPELINPRSERSLLGRVVNFSELLSETVLTKTRGGLTILDEIEALRNRFQPAFEAAFIDDLSFLNGVSGYSYHGRQVIYDGDILIPADSIEGTIQLGLLRSQLAGEDMNVIANDMDMVKSNYTGHLNNSSKTPYVINVKGVMVLQYF